MTNYRIYSSATYTVFRRGPGVEILNIPSNATQWLQGEEADQLEDDLDTGYEIDSHLSQYFGN